MNNTPRTDAFYENLYDPSVPQDLRDAVDAKEKAFARKLEQEINALVKLLEEAIGHIEVSATECHGNKCRELNCRSCFDEETVSTRIEDNYSLIARINAALIISKDQK